MNIIDADAAEEMYREMLDECCPSVFNIPPSRILEECDPIAYRVGKADYIDDLSQQGILVRGYTAEDEAN